MSDIVILTSEGSCKTMLRKELQEYFNQNKDSLMKFMFEDIPVWVVANFSGWCTCMTEKNSIIQVWAGQLTLG